MDKLIWKFMLFCARHPSLLRFYRCMVTVHKKGKTKKTFVYKLKPGDVLKGDNNTTYVVCGAVYDDGIDDMIPCVCNGERIDISPLLVD